MAITTGLVHANAPIKLQTGESSDSAHATLTVEVAVDVVVVAVTVSVTVVEVSVAVMVVAVVADVEVDVAVVTVVVAIVVSKWQVERRGKSSTLADPFVTVASAVISSSSKLHRVIFEWSFCA